MDVANANSSYAAKPGDADWVDATGYYQPLDHWMRLCGLYEHYRFALTLLGNLENKRILDSGCGKGHTSVMLARRGAQVDAFDASGPELAIARRLAQANGVSVQHRELVFEEIDYQNERFDLAFGTCVLHHVQIPQAMKQLNRVLKPGARAVFVENSARNAVLMWARRHIVGRMGVPRYGDDHEHPLRASDFAVMRRYFQGTVTVHHPEFVFFRLFDFYVLKGRFPLASAVLRLADKMCGSLPWISTFGYFLVVQMDRNQVAAAAPDTSPRRAASTEACLLAACLVFGLHAPAEAKNEFRLKNDKAAASCREDVRTPTPRSREIPGAVKVVASKAIYAGVYSIGTTRADVLAFQSKTGHPPAIVFTFHDWITDDDFAAKHPRLRTFNSDMEDRGVTPIQLAEQLHRRNSVLALTWALQCCDWSSVSWWYGFRKTAVSVPRVLKGDFDDYIRRVAGEVKAYGKPLMLSLFSELNWQAAMSFGKDGTTRISEADDICGQYGDPAWPDGPERVRDVHMHVIDIFRAEGVKNVTWFMYANSGYMDPQAKDFSIWLHPRFLYPGDAYIDWVGQSTYFIDPRWGHSPSEDASTIERALLPGYKAWGEVTQRPMFLPEFGPVGDKQTDRGPVLKQVMTEVLPTLPRVRALTLADALLFEICCQLPRLGQHFAGEKEAWRQSIANSPAYTFKVQFGNVSASDRP